LLVNRSAGIDNSNYLDLREIREDCGET